jgi:hypothetical protein
MRRVVSFVVLALAVALVPGTARALGIGLGVFGGTSIPVNQSDVKTGGMYGVRLPLTIIPLVSVEPYWAQSKLADGQENGMTIDGFDNSSFGVNAILGSLLNAPGIKFYPYLGIASSKLTRTGFSDINKTSYNFGLGAGLGFSKIALHGRAELNVIDTGSKTREFANLTVGLSYDLWSKL